MKALRAFVVSKSNLIAVLLLALMFGLGAMSMSRDSGIVDEIAHIPAGYSYLKYHDYRLNPEHPPLIKDLAAAPLLFLKLQFPTDNAAWTTDVNGQWEAGWHFLYHDGNNPDHILFFARLPILVLAIILGWVLYRFVRNRFGIGAGLLALFLFVLCPNTLAHSRFVTTDLGAAAFIFFSFVTFVRWLEKPSKLNLLWATIFFALAQLAKFNAVLLAPFYLGLIIVAVLAWSEKGQWKDKLKTYLLGYILLGIGALALIWLFYLPMTISMPAAVQDRLIAGSLTSKLGQAINGPLMALNNTLPGKVMAQYLLGVAMVFSRVGGGNTTYFMGEVTNQSFKWYFPVTYLIKTPIALLALEVLAVLAGVLAYLRKSPLKVWGNLVGYLRSHFVEAFGLAWIAFYSYISITGNLNLGIRHLLPMFPFIFMVVAVATVSWVRKAKATRVHATMLVALLMVYYAASNFLAYPAYLSYFNELIGGSSNAYKYVSDSSVDWGQDLIRLKDYVDAHPEIDKIGVDYFGGGEPKYYFCDRKYDASGSLIKSSAGYDCSKSKYIEWHAQDGVYKGYMAVSETFLTNDIFWAPMRGDVGYTNLRKQQPVAKVGGSIYVYKTQ